MPDISRRRLLAGGAVVVTGGYGGYRLVRGQHDAEFDTWTPGPGTWPLERYDPANTAHNPHASPPRETPEKRKLATVEIEDTSRPQFSPLAGPDQLVMYGDRVAAVTENGAIPYGEYSAFYAGFGPDGDLYAVRYRSDHGYDLLVYDGREESDQYNVSNRPMWLTIGREETYLGTRSDGVFAYERAGGRDWAVQGSKTALADGHLYTVAENTGPRAYRERASPGKWVFVGPEREWAGKTVWGNMLAPAVADGRLVVGTHGWGSIHHLTAFDAETGERLWEPKSFANDGRAFVDTPAVAGRDGYVAAGVNDVEEGFVARYDLETGEEVWRDDTDWFAYGPVLAGETLVVAGDVRTSPEPPAGKVRAYDTESGDELWTVTFSWESGTNLALVGDRVLATSGTSLYELA